MWLHPLLTVTAVLLASTACVHSQIPVEASAPRSTEVILRVGGAQRGILVFADTDSLVMTDMRAGERVTIRPGSDVLLEVYRGQRRTAEAVVKGAGKGFVEGAATGAAEVLLVAGLGKLLGLDLGGMNLGESVKGGIVFGGAIGGLVGKNKGMQEGEAVWERVTLSQLRQQLCRCAYPDGPRVEPIDRLIPQP